eukprot:4217056-Amphidinium_carterae.1
MVHSIIPRKRCVRKPSGFVTVSAALQPHWEMVFENAGKLKLLADPLATTGVGREQHADLGTL